MPEQASDRRTVRVRLEGHVQGVGFRYWTERAATDLGLDGWVRNRRDGGVEAVFSGGAGRGRPDARALPARSAVGTRRFRQSLGRDAGAAAGLRGAPHRVRWPQIRRSAARRKPLRIGS